MAVKFIVTHGYIRYGGHRGLPRIGNCELCSAEQLLLVFDHCHAHGWIRGRTCQPCNMLLPAAETGIVVTDVQAGHLANCPECPAAAIWLAGKVPRRQVPSRCPADCSNGLLYLRSLGRLAACPVCSGG